MPAMTARSVVLSVLLGAHPAWATASELIQLTADFGIKETTLRVALTRMVGAGDLVRSADGYRLSDRLLARQRRQDEAMRPRTRAWHGNWHMLIVTSIGTDARTRAATSDSKSRSRLSGRIHTPSRDEAPADLAGQLWDLSGWTEAGHRLLGDMAAATDMPGRFVVAAAMVRHLLTDPMLPAELLPADWPGAGLRAAYHDFATAMAKRRDATQLLEVT